MLTLDAKQRMFTIVGTFGYSGDRDSLGGVNEIAFTEPVAQQLMLGETGRVQQHRRARAPTAPSPDGAQGSRSRRPSAPTTRCAPARRPPPTTPRGSRPAWASSTTSCSGFAGIALFVGIFLIINTFSIVVAQRTKELALLRAIGAGRRQVIGSVHDRGGDRRHGRVGHRPRRRHRGRRAARVPGRQVRRWPDAGRARRTPDRDHRVLRGRPGGHRDRRGDAGAAGLADPADRRHAGRGDPGPSAHEDHHDRRRGHRARGRRCSASACTRTAAC